MKIHVVDDDGEPKGFGSTEGLPLPIDYHKATSFCGGSANLVDKVVVVFRNSIPDDLAEIREALNARDAENLASLAHRVKGEAATIAAEPIRAITEILEIIGRECRLDEAPAYFEELEKEFARFCEYTDGTSAEAA